MSHPRSEKSPWGGFQAHPQIPRVRPTLPKTPPGLTVGGSRARFGKSFLEGSSTCHPKSRSKGRCQSGETTWHHANTLDQKNARAQPARKRTRRAHRKAVRGAVQAHTTPHVSLTQTQEIHLKIKAHGPLPPQNQNHTSGALKTSKARIFCGCTRAVGGLAGGRRTSRAQPQEALEALFRVTPVGRHPGRRKPVGRKGTSRGCGSGLLATGTRAAGAPRDRIEPSLESEAALSTGFHLGKRADLQR
jgi:hypothetical protein